MEKHLLDLNIEELAQEMQKLGQPMFRAKQLFSWLHSGAQLEGMTNLPKSFRQKLAEEYTLGGAQIYHTYISKIDGTRKYLFSLEDQQIIEGVLMQYHYGNTICISSQVGCRMGCRFCASTLEGLVRNLSPGEMLGQVIAVNRDLEAQQMKKISNIVMMGSGEPLDNFENVVKFLQLIHSEQGLHISMRNISVSTCGLVDKIYELEKLHLGVTLAVSLHAADDETRKRIMPVANRFSVAEVIGAVKHYTEATGRRAVFEYALADGVNDSVKDAHKLSCLLKGLLCHVNLIPLNEVKERQMHTSAARTVKCFQEVLTQNGISCTVRRTMGSDIAGACGQLRRSVVQKEQAESSE